MADNRPDSSSNAPVANRPPVVPPHPAAVRMEQQPIIRPEDSILLNRRVRRPAVQAPLPVQVFAQPVAIRPIEIPVNIVTRNRSLLFEGRPQREVPLRPRDSSIPTNIVSRNVSWIRETEQRNGPRLRAQSATNTNTRPLQNTTRNPRRIPNFVRNESAEEINEREVRATTITEELMAEISDEEESNGESTVEKMPIDPFKCKLFCLDLKLNSRRSMRSVYRGKLLANSEAPRNNKDFLGSLFDVHLDMRPSWVDESFEYKSSLPEVVPTCPELSSLLLTQFMRYQLWKEQFPDESALSHKVRDYIDFFREEFRETNSAGCIEMNEAIVLNGKTFAIPYAFWTEEHSKYYPHVRRAIDSTPEHLVHARIERIPFTLTRQVVKPFVGFWHESQGAGDLPSVEFSARIVSDSVNRAMCHKTIRSAVWNRTRPPMHDVEPEARDTIKKIFEDLMNETIPFSYASRLPEFLILGRPLTFARKPEIWNNEWDALYPIVASEDTLYSEAFFVYKGKKLTTVAERIIAPEEEFKFVNRDTSSEMEEGDGNVANDENEPATSDETRTASTTSSMTANNGRVPKRVRIGKKVLVIKFPTDQEQ